MLIITIFLSCLPFDSDILLLINISHKRVSYLLTQVTSCVDKTEQSLHPPYFPTSCTVHLSLLRLRSSPLQAMSPDYNYSSSYSGDLESTVLELQYSM